MIKTIKYQEALDTRFLPTTVVKVYVFKQVNLPCCVKWEDEVLSPITEKYNMFEWMQIMNDQNIIPFPSAIAPTFYFIIPDGGNLNFIRSGEVTYEQLDKECAKFLKIQNGMYYVEALEL
jgi:hypothetical protein